MIDAVQSALPAENAPRQTVVTSRVRLLVIGCALVAFTLKLMIALQTIGTNDTVTFYRFAQMLSAQGLEWTYRNDISFNHPPLTAYFLRLILPLEKIPSLSALGIDFPFLLRFPGILADFVVVIVVLRISETVRAVPPWALALFALSPVSLMISGFHGNTDSVMVMFLALATLMSVRNRPIWCAVFMALSCQVKIVPLLLLPILFFFWCARGAGFRFSIAFTLVCAIGWIQPLIHFPLLLLKNVLSYGSFWGIWGLTYWLRMTGLPMFGAVTYYHFPPAEAAIVFALKLVLIACVLTLAWRRREVSPVRLIDSLAYAWLIFFAIAPGICAQYMVWLAPFVLLLSPTFYAWITATSALFLFYFYNTTAGGLPWHLAISTAQLNTVWTPWTAWPWAAILVALVVLWRKARREDPTLRLVSAKLVR